MRKRSQKAFGKGGFRQQLVTTFTVGILLLAIASSIAVSTLSSRSVHYTLVEQGRQAAEAFASQSTLALLYHSPENALEAVNTTLAFPDIRAVAIYDLNYVPLLIEGKAELMGRAAAQWPDVPRLVRETDAEWEFIAPVYSHPLGSDDEESPFVTSTPDPQLLGYVRVIMGKETLHTLGGDILRGNFSVLMTLSGLLLLVLLAITTRLTKPLRYLSEFMQRAESGEKGVRAAIRGPKEIRNMEAVFNNMMDVLEAREEELKTARDMALESARIKGEFAANVSHELRTPLNSVLGMLELLNGMGLTPKQREYVDIARNSGESLLSLIDDILDFSKIDARKLEIAPTDFFLQETLDDVVALLAGQAQRKDLDLGYVVSPGVPAAVVADATRIRQVLINLIGNAIKFTEEGEVAVDVSVAADLGDEVRVRFEVRDTGIGIPADARERIFQAFSQADGSTTRKYGGTGLGLAISSQLVQLMGGEIGVDSEPGEGSVFWFVLPLRRSQQMPGLAEVDRSAMAGVRILLAEDSRVTRTYLEQMLSGWGAQHDSAEDGRVALERLRAATAEGSAYELLLLDESMPGVTGLDLIRQIQADPDIQSPRILLLSSPQSHLDPDELPAHVDVISKPIRESVVYEALTGLMQPHGSAGRRNAARVSAEPPPESEAPVLYGKHILVVEDNRANQQVAVGMLERLGCTSEVVSSGVEALDAVARRRHDAVLMDCQMPQMDGYEATARIRSLETGDRHLPIIAMTANVQRGDAEKCFSAGMDDYLPKPLKLAALREALLRWFPEPLDEDAPGVRDGAPGYASRPEAALTVEVLSELRESVGDAFGEMIRVFLEDAPTYIARIEAAVTHADAKALRDAAHSLKGSARNFGADRLAAVCRELEENGGRGDLQGAQALVRTLHNEYRHVRTLLQQEIHVDEARSYVGEETQPRVLVVDDDRGMRYALRNVLEEDGYRVEEAGNGALALAICERRMPDLVLMDAVMPVMDGFQACRRLRELPGSDHTPVLIITALDDEDSIERAFASGAKDYIPKPLHFAVLRQRVARLLKASRAEKHVRQLAYHDTLTGLPNRAQFTEHLSRLLERSRPPGELLAVLFIDLDRFKLVNDTLGHDVGDLLLKAVAERIMGCVRTSDLVARLGGDEFTIVLDGLKSADVVAAISEKICTVLSKPFVFMGQEMYVTASIGISMYPVDGADTGTLVKHADTAMFRAKERGDKYQFYEYGMESAVSKRLALDSDLRRAFEREELVVYYQPQAELETGRVVGMEALVRWQHPERGLVPPADFIPLAEETGLIVALGEWVLRHACTQLQQWLKEGGEELRLSVNISGRQLERSDFPDRVAALLEETGLPPRLLELEITESTLMRRADDVIPMLQRLKGMGLQLAIDDFGTGYSSLNYLKRFPIDVLKVDRSFVRDIVTDPDDGAILTAIIVLAKSLRLKVVAEGVETAEQQDFLKVQHCDLLQGYILSPPVNAAAFAGRFLRRKPRRGRGGHSNVRVLPRRKDPS